MLWIFWVNRMGTSSKWMRHSKNRHLCVNSCSNRSVLLWRRSGNLDSSHVYLGIPKYIQSDLNETLRGFVIQVILECPQLQKKNDINHMLSIWDAAIPAAADVSWMMSWWSYVVSKNATSITLLDEVNAERWRARFWIWVGCPVKMHVSNARVVNHLALRPSFSC